MVKVLRVFYRPDLDMVLKFIIQNCCFDDSNSGAWVFVWNKILIMIVIFSFLLLE